MQVGDPLHKREVLHTVQVASQCTHPYRAPTVLYRKPY
jgi:hypothetical protein